MNNQNNAGNINLDVASKKPTPKKKVGCFGCLGIALLTILIIVVAFFAINKIRKNIKEKREEKLEARFNYELKLSSEDKLNQAYEQGEISTDAYILQLAYSMYDAGQLDPLYKSDNEIDIAPNISDLLMKHIDELSDETLEYIVKNMLTMDVRIGPDASQNSMSSEEKWRPFSKKAYASAYDVTVLDKAVLSPSGRFLIWYTETGESAVKDKEIEELANTIDNITADIENFLDIGWAYNLDKFNSGSYEDMKSVLQKCGIDENVMGEAFPIYVFEPSKDSNSLAWYIRELTGSQERLFRLGKALNLVFDLEDTLTELASVYSVPYIVIRPSSFSDMDSLNVLFSHELTHHFQVIYYDDLDHYAPGFTSETVANFVAASITNIKDTKTLTNNHANQYMEITEEHFSKMIFGESSGYAEFIWAKSYVDIVANGKQYLKESLLEDDPFDFLYKKAGDSYQLVLEDIAVRNITKDYKEKAFVSTKYPTPKAKLDRYMDEEKGSIYPNGFHYYYMDSRSFNKSESAIHLKNNGSASIFIKVMGRKKDNYSLIDSLYCERDKELLIADFSGDKYKKYDEIILALGKCDIVGNAEYQLISLSSSVVDLYDTLTGLKDLNPWVINGDCITIHVDDFVEGAIKIADYLKRASTHANNNIQSDDTEQVMDYINSFQDEINRIGEGFKKFADVFEYKTIRIYTIPIEDTMFSDDELHERVFDTLPKLKFKVISKIEDGMHLTVGAGIRPLSKTQIILTVTLTQSEGEKFVYRIEVEK